MPSHEEAIEKATLLMRRFAERTGLTSDRPTQRYLWTDAFAVCNFLGLARLTGERSYADLALRLVDQVHHVLGRYRADDTRAGWISGLGEREGEAHPTRGGLRIGKALLERGPGEPFDQGLEWDRDGMLLDRLLEAAHDGLAHYSQHGDRQQPGSRRLAFRELGLAIGLAAVEGLEKDTDDGRRRAFGRDDLRARVHALASYVGLRAAIVPSWLGPKHQRLSAWSEHRDINEVMLATSLAPDGFLVIAARSEPPGSRSRGH